MTTGKKVTYRDAFDNDEFVDKFREIDEDVPFDDDDIDMYDGVDDTESTPIADSVVTAKTSLVGTKSKDKFKRELDSAYDESSFDISKRSTSEIDESSISSRSRIAAKQRVLRPPISFGSDDSRNARMMKQDEKRERLTKKLNWLAEKSPENDSNTTTNVNSRKDDVSIGDKVVVDSNVNGTNDSSSSPNGVRDRFETIDLNESATSTAVEEVLEEGMNVDRVDRRGRRYDDEIVDRPESSGTDCRYNDDFKVRHVRKFVVDVIDDRYAYRREVIERKWQSFRIPRLESSNGLIELRHLLNLNGRCEYKLIDTPIKNHVVALIIEIDSDENSYDFDARECVGASVCDHNMTNDRNARKTLSPEIVANVSRERVSSKDDCGWTDVKSQAGKNRRKRDDESGYARENQRRSTKKIDPLRYKHMMCKNFYKIGKCLNEETCSYSHSIADISKYIKPCQEGKDCKRVISSTTTCLDPKTGKRSFVITYANAKRPNNGSTHRDDMYVCERMHSAENLENYVRRTTGTVREFE